MKGTIPKSFLALIEDEHDTIRHLWRAQRQCSLSLPQQYAEIQRAILPRLAARLGCACDQIPQGYQDQIAHAVFARAIEEPALRGSMAGDLIEAIYYHSGGSLDLEQYGRLCFCSAYWEKRPRPDALHPSSCDQLWAAYCRAMNDLLERREDLPTTAADTRASIAEGEDSTQFLSLSRATDNNERSMC